MLPGIAKSYDVFVTDPRDREFYLISKRLESTVGFVRESLQFLSTTATKKQ